MGGGGGYLFALDLPGVMHQKSKWAGGLRVRRWCVQRQLTSTELHFQTGTAGTDCRVRLQAAPVLDFSVPVLVWNGREQNGNRTGTAEREGELKKKKKR